MMEMPHASEVARELQRSNEKEKPSTREQWLKIYGSQVETALTAADSLLDHDGIGETTAIATALEEMKSLWSTFGVEPEDMQHARQSLEGFLRVKESQTGSLFQPLYDLRQHLLRLQKYGEAMAAATDEAE